MQKTNETSSMIYELCLEVSFRKYAQLFSTAVSAILHHLTWRMCHTSSKVLRDLFRALSDSVSFWTLIVD